VTRDFVRNCPTPIRVLPDDVSGHPYCGRDGESAPPNAQVGLYPRKDIPPAVRHIRTFLKAHRPATVTVRAMAAAAR
jgi:hypothetical protein